MFESFQFDSIETKQLLEDFFRKTNVYCVLDKTKVITRAQAEDIINDINKLVSHKISRK